MQNCATFSLSLSPVTFGLVPSARLTGMKTVRDTLYHLEPASNSVNPVLEISVRGLFGEYCSGNVFRHDTLMERRLEEFRPRGYEMSSQSTTNSVAIPIEVPKAAGVSPPRQTTPTNTSPADMDPANLNSGYRKRDYQEYTADEPYSDNNQDSQDSQSSFVSEHALEIRTTAYRALLANARGSDAQFVGLISTTDNHSAIENELPGL